MEIIYEYRLCKLMQNYENQIPDVMPDVKEQSFCFLAEITHTLVTKITVATIQHAAPQMYLLHLHAFPEPFLKIEFSVFLFLSTFLSRNKRM